MLAVLVGMIMLAWIVSAWLHEAERLGTPFGSHNRLDLLQSAPNGCVTCRSARGHQPEPSCAA